LQINEKEKTITFVAVNHPAALSDCIINIIIIIIISSSSPRSNYDTHIYGDAQQPCGLKK